MSRPTTARNGTRNRTQRHATAQRLNATAAAAAVGGEEDDDPQAAQWQREAFKTSALRCMAVTEVSHQLQPLLNECAAGFVRRQARFMHEYERAGLAEDDCGEVEDCLRSLADEYAA